MRALAEGDIADLEMLIERRIQTPTDAMSASFSALSDEHRALVFALLNAAPGPVEERQIAHLVRLHHPQGFSRSPMEVVDRLTDHFLRVTDALKVDWVHPSWRDLVIDRLRRDTKARAAFLERCTVEGRLLAISTANSGLALPAEVPLSHRFGAGSACYAAMLARVGDRCSGRRALGFEGL